MTHTRRVVLPGSGRVALALTAAFVAVAVLVVVQGDSAGDERVLRWVASAEDLDGAARVIDRWTGYLPVGIAAGAIVLVLACVRRWRRAAFTAVAVGGTILGNALLKRVVGRDRPDLLPAGADVSSLSFPSGHAAATAALALVVVLLLVGTRSVTPAVVTAVVVVGVAGAAQLVLAQHHATDILGGWLWAGAWTTAVCSVVCARDQR